MMSQNVLDTIQELNGQYLDILEDLCNLESPTADKARVDAVSAYIACWGRQMGFDVLVEPMEGSGDPVCITMNGGAEAAPLVMSGHIDTVHPVGLFPTPAVHRDETKMYGPGATDCKGGVAAAMLAMAALDKCEFTGRPVKLIIQTDEETSSKGSGKKTIDFMLKHAEGAAAFLNTEGCVDYKAIVERKGIARFRLTVHGKAAHSASCWDGVNAVTEAAHKILKLEQFKDKEGITCNCGVISGGTVANAVAETCSFLADFRYATTDQYEQVMAALQDVANNGTLTGTTCEIESVSSRPPMPRVEANLSLLARMNEIYEKNGVHTVTGEFSRGGSDASYTTLAGIPTVDSVGVNGGRIHSVEEYMYMATLAEAAARLALVAIEL